MTRIIIIIAILLNSYLVLGCVFDSDSSDNDESKDKGTYTIISKPEFLQSYPGGGGLFTLEIMPSDDFEGKVSLSIIADPLLNARLTTDFLSSDKRVVEFEIYPETSAVLRWYFVKIISSHAEKADTLYKRINLKELIDLGEEFSTYPYAKNNQTEFVKFLEDVFPEFGITTNQEWFSYNNRPIKSLDELGVPVDWTFLNDTWDINVYAYGGPVNSVWVFLREREQTELLFAAYKDMNVDFHEIPVSDFLKPR